ncbi:homoserine O-acetyltransferase [Candidatus Sumerlaeota bacterium]|nr:homoserine O-acetyltransferase [Candidatus Sumerlaeota bacterium]
MNHTGSVGTVETQLFRFGSPDEPFVLECGATLPGVQLAYETYGKLSPQRDNAVLVFHALTGSQHAAGHNPRLADNPLWTEECHLGWWEQFIGPGKAIDTDHLFVICVNYLGSCYGTTGPHSINPETGKPYGSAFPEITIGDIVRSQIPLLDHLGIDILLAATGGSMGGMMAMDLALRTPSRVRLVIPIAAAAGVSELTKLHNFEQMFALIEDPNFNGGDYYDQPERPWLGLVLARMISHKTFVHLGVLRERALGEIVQPSDVVRGYRLRHRTESYMLHHGKKFATRFDTNSYIRILGAWQSFDLARAHGGGDLAAAFRRSAEAAHRYLVFTISSDVCFYPEEQVVIVDALKADGIEHQYYTINSDKGHDSFLIEPSLYSPLLRHALKEEVRLIRGEV